jgi:phosphatidylserine/phosphatidylglycerophosphate/cardiolipin synthase-like enzyme
VKVEAILDKSQERGTYSGATFLANAGIPVWIDHKPAIAHNKIILVDADTVITGSYNFTTAAEKRNAENILIITRAPRLNARYRDYYDSRRQASRPIARPAQ